MSCFDIDDDRVDLGGVGDLDQAIPALRIAENAEIRVDRLDHLRVERGGDVARCIDAQRLIGKSRSRDHYLCDVGPAGQAKCAVRPGIALRAAICGGNASPGIGAPAASVT